VILQFLYISGTWEGSSILGAAKKVWAVGARRDFELSHRPDISIQCAEDRYNLFLNTSFSSLGALLSVDHAFLRDIQKWVKSPKTRGRAAICGEISGDLLRVSDLRQRAFASALPIAEVELGLLGVGGSEVVFFDLVVEGGAVDF
jgi:hypothetical protein